MITQYFTYKITLLNTDLESQEHHFHYLIAVTLEIAERLRKFLPVSLIHTVLLERIEHSGDCKIYKEWEY